MVFDYKVSRQTGGRWYEVSMIVTVKRNPITARFKCFKDNDDQTYSIGESFFTNHIDTGIRQVDEWNKSMPDSWGYQIKEISNKTYSPEDVYEKLMPGRNFKYLAWINDFGTIIK
jgi:hypothetical protein